MVRLDEDALYYFLQLNDGKFYTQFIGRLKEDRLITLLEYFSLHDKGKAYIWIEINVGENTFIVKTDQPFYLVNLDNDDAFEFAGDDGVLELYPSGNVPSDPDLAETVDFPTYWENGVESMIDFKIADKFYH